MEVNINAKFEDKTTDGWRLTGKAPMEWSQYGTFMLTVPTGTVAIEVGNLPDHSSAYSAAAERWQVPENGLENAVLKVGRNPGLLVHLRRKRDEDALPAGTYAIHVRDAANRQTALNVLTERGSCLAFHPLRRWGEVREIRAFRDHLSITPWTRVVADRKHWPVILTPE